MNLKFVSETISASGIVPCVCPFINFLNQTDKPQIVKVGKVDFYLDSGASMSFPPTGINPIVNVNNDFLVTFTAPTNSRNLIVTRGYFLD